MLLDKNEENLAVLHEIKNLGVSIVLDDFGIGYSSMRYLQMFPFDKIKIDKSFIQSMTSHSDSAAIVCAITGLGRALDIETTAEGVETAEQLTFLRSAGLPVGARLSCSAGRFRSPSSPSRAPASCKTAQRPPEAIILSAAIIEWRMSWSENRFPLFRDMRQYYCVTSARSASQ